MLSVFISGHTIAQVNNLADTDWCNHPLRESLRKLPEIKTSGNWFRVYRAGKNVIAIVEPYNFEEVISYLILGKTKAILFDTGIGVDSISTLVKQLTDLPVTVLNSHTHFDHMGGNHEFASISALNNSYTIQNAKKGWSHDVIKDEVTQAACCLQRLRNFDTSQYAVQPFTISQFVKNGDEIDIGDRKLKIITVPGHTPDAIALLDKTNGYIWAGDTFYEGPIYLFAKGTDLAAYEKSISILADMAPQLKKVFPAHNNPVCPPERLTELKDNFSKMKTGKMKHTDAGDNKLLFEFPHFSFLIAEDQLLKLRSS